MKTSEPAHAPGHRHSCLCLFRIVIVCVCALLFIPDHATAGENWTEFRGPGGQGHSATTGLPLKWSPTSNIRWKAEIPGRGWSSPVVLNGRVYLTTAVPAKSESSSQRSLRTLCLDAGTGEILWNVEVFPLIEGDRAQMHRKNSHASPTPVTDGKHLFVHFGTQGTACLTLEGEVVWKTRELEFSPQHGNGNSPVMFHDLLIVNCDGSNIQFVVALEKSTGKIRWKKPRPPVDEIKKFAFATPLVIEVEGTHQLVSPGAHVVVAYNPADGEELWRVRHHGYSLATRPVYGNGLVYVCTSFDKSTLLAIDPTGHGDVTDTHVRWKTERGAPHTPSPLLLDDNLYFMSDQGVATCVDAKTGNVYWTHRVGGNYSASPLFADGKIYFQSEKGETIVIRPGKKYEELARNQLNSGTLASLAVDGHAILLRTEDALYRVEEP